MTGMRMSVSSSSKAPRSRASTIERLGAVVRGRRPRARPARARGRRGCAAPPRPRRSECVPSTRSSVDPHDRRRRSRRLKKRTSTSWRFGRRRSEPRAERQRFARRQHAAARQRGPGVDLLARCVADREPQPRHLGGARPWRSRWCPRPPAPARRHGSRSRSRRSAKARPRKLTGSPIAAYSEAVCGSKLHHLGAPADQRGVERHQRQDGGRQAGQRPMRRRRRAAFWRERRAAKVSMSSGERGVGGRPRAVMLGSAPVGRRSATGSRGWSRSWSDQAAARRGASSAGGASNTAGPVSGRCWRLLRDG